MYAIDANLIVTTLLGCADDEPDLEATALRADYRGRGMYGDCLALVTDLPVAVALFEFDLATTIAVEAKGSAMPDLDDVREVVFQLARGRRQDGMGLSTVYYWPSVTVTGNLAEAVEDYS